MSRAFAGRRVAALTAVLGSTLLVGACSDDRSIIYEPYGSPSINVLLVANSSNTPRGTVVTSAGQIRLTLNALEPLTNGVYQVWLGDVNGANWTKASGTVAVFRVDTTTTPEGDREIDTTAVGASVTGSSFTAGGTNTFVRLTVTTASLGRDPLTSRTVLVSVEDNADATAPGSSRPLWAILDNSPPTGAATETYPLLFGTYDPDPTKAYVFSVAGRGVVSVRDDILIEADSGLPRPPVGYYYASFLVRRTAAGAVDPAASLRVGPIRTPDRSRSLEDADVTLLPGLVEADPPAIIAAANKVNADTITSLAPNEATYFTRIGSFDIYYVSLKHKKAAPEVPSPTLILLGEVPAALRVERDGGED